jgi:hypothetical protein
LAAEEWAAIFRAPMIEDIQKAVEAGNFQNTPGTP